MRPFQEGIKDFKEGTIGNPYKVGTKDYQDYALGFNKAYFSNKRRQVEYERTFNKKGKELLRKNTAKS